MRSNNCNDARSLKLQPPRPPNFNVDWQYTYRAPWTPVSCYNIELRGAGGATSHKLSMYLVFALPYHWQYFRRPLSGYLTFGVRGEQHLRSSACILCLPCQTTGAGLAASWAGLGRVGPGPCGLGRVGLGRIGSGRVGSGRRAEEEGRS